MQTCHAGSNYKIIGFQKDIQPSYRHKLMTMGMIPGATFKVCRVAPMGDPLLIEVKRFRLSIRKVELDAIAFESAS